MTPLELLAAARHADEVRRIRSATRARPGSPIGRKGLAIVGGSAAVAMAAASAAATAAALATVASRDTGGVRRLQEPLAGRATPHRPGKGRVPRSRKSRASARKCPWPGLRL